MNWLLLGVILVVVILAIVGWVVGFSKMMMSMVSIIVVLVVTFVFSPKVANILKEKEGVYNPIYEKVDSVINLSDGATTGKTAEEIINGLKVPQAIKDMILSNETFSEYVGTEIETIEVGINKSLTEMAIKALAFVGTFIASAIIMALLSILLKAISKLPVIHQIDSIAGAALGTLEGILAVWVFFVIVTLLGTTSVGITLLGMIEENSILSFIYDHNLITYFLMG